MDCESISKQYLKSLVSNIQNSPSGWDDDNDGWGDDDFGSDSKTSKPNIDDDDDDDFFASFDSSKPVKTVIGGLSPSKPVPKSNQSSGLKVKKTPKPAVKKLPVNIDSLDDGWDDF